MLAHEISDLIKASPGASQVVAIDEPQPDLGPELTLAGPIAGHARLHRTQRGALVQCGVATIVQLQCARCLEPFLQPASLAFEEEYLLPLEQGGPAEPEAEPTFEIDEHHVLDLTDAVRQYLTMELPLAPLCRPDCPGLCPVCGAPLAGHVCPVGEGPPSSPFAALRDLYPEHPSRSTGDDSG